MIKVNRTAGMRGLLWWVLLVSSTAPMSACSGEVSRKWTEEVQVDATNVIVVDRHVKFRESNSSAGDAYSSAELQSTLKFSGDLSTTPAWDVPLVPLVLYRDQPSGDWVIVATTHSCDVWSNRGSPPAPYWEFRAAPGAGTWKEAPLSPASEGKTANLFFIYEGQEPPSKLTTSMKDQLLRKELIGRTYKQISRSNRTHCNKYAE